jgi:CBS-domain-containing membrane protein
MTPEVKCCFEDEDLDHVAKNLADIQVQRLPVMNRDKRLVDVLSLGDIAFEAGRGPERQGPRGHLAAGRPAQPGGDDAGRRHKPGTAR